MKKVLSEDFVEEVELSKRNYPAVPLNTIPGTASLPDHKLTLIKSYMVVLFQTLQQKYVHVNGTSYII